MAVGLLRLIRDPSGLYRWRPDERPCRPLPRDGNRGLPELKRKPEPSLQKGPGTPKNSKKDTRIFPCLVLDEAMYRSHGLLVRPIVSFPIADSKNRFLFVRDGISKRTRHAAVNDFKSTIQGKPSFYTGRPIRVAENRCRQRFPWIGYLAAVVKKLQQTRLPSERIGGGDSSTLLYRHDAQRENPCQNAEDQTAQCLSDQDTFGAGP